MRAIGELARDVVARSYEAMQRGSCEPREFAEVTLCGFTVGGMRFLLCVEAAEVEFPSVYSDAGDKLGIIPVLAAANALEVLAAPALLVHHVLCVRSRSQIGNPVIVAVAVDVVDKKVGAVTMDEPPCEPTCRVDAMTEPDQTVSIVVHRSGSGPRPHSRRSWSNPREVTREWVISQV